jgi:hypothetical protein
MTYGHGYEPTDGWPPPSDPEPTLYGRRRRAPEDEEPYPDPEYRPRRSADPEDGGTLTDRYVPRPGGREGSGGRESTGTIWQSTGDTGVARVPSPSPHPPERTSGRFPSVPPMPTSPPRPHPHPLPPPHLDPRGYPGGGLQPMEPMERSHRTGQVPQQWHVPDDVPDLDLPDRHRPRSLGAFDREARHGQDGPPPPPKAAPWQTALGLVAVVVLVAVCAAGGYFMFSDHGPADAGVPGAPKPHDISNRRSDPTPLSAAEVFPAATVAGGYQVLKSEALAECKSAAVGQPVQMLAVQDCSQVVRGTLVSADNGYVVTVGMFNFGTQVNAEQASDSIRDSVGAQKGRFTGYNLGVPPSDVYARAATQLGWDVRGHFLAYCVVARADGQAIPSGDAAVHKMIDDLVEKYLIGTVIQARVSPPSASASAK